MHNVWSVFEPKSNIDGGVRHLRLLLDQYNGNVRLALAAYNAGDGAVERHGGIPPYPETIQYLERVLRFRDQYLREP
jgi:soluble lytic murein transglycosylase-like protein